MQSRTSRSTAPTGRRTRRWAVFLATGLGAGYLPRIPGTWGSALGVATYWVVWQTLSAAGAGPWAMATTVLAVVAAAFPVVASALPYFSEKDPGAIVLDEVAGQMVALLPLAWWPRPLGFGALAAAFVLFRAADILKPYPIRKLERLKGAAGIVADDLAAGGLAAALLWAMNEVGWLSPYLG